MSAATAIVLHQFAASHFNEKARWALDWKGLAHRRQTYLPGPHMSKIRKLSGGSTSTPVLQIGDEIVAGSAAIIDRLESDHPRKPLYPQDPALRRRALELQEIFDREVGPAVRTAVFSILIDEPGYLARVFAGHCPAAKRLAYRATLPLARRLIAKANQADDPEAIARAFERSRAAFDEVAATVGETGHLVGGEFSVADLTAAALLAPAVNPDHPDMARPTPMSRRMAAFTEQWRQHEGAAWVLETYRRHRPKALAPAA